MTAYNSQYTAFPLGDLISERCRPSIRLSIHRFDRSVRANEPRKERNGNLQQQQQHSFNGRIPGHHSAFYWS